MQEKVAEKLQSKLRAAVREAGDAKDEAEAKSVRGWVCLVASFGSLL